MKIYQTFTSQTVLHLNILRKVITLALGLAVILVITNSSLANQRETNRLMFQAAKLSQDGKNEEALKMLLEIIRKEPKNFYAYNNVAMVHSEMQEYDKALEAYESSLSINPTFPMALNNIGHLHMTMGHHDKAEAFFKKALTFFKTFHLASTNLGELYLKQKRYSEAMKYLRKSLADMPTLSRPHKLIGEIHRAQGRNEEAKKEFNLFRQLSKKSK